MYFFAAFIKKQPSKIPTHTKIACVCCVVCVNFVLFMDDIWLATHIYFCLSFTIILPPGHVTCIFSLAFLQLTQTPTPSNQPKPIQANQNAALFESTNENAVESKAANQSTESLDQLGSQDTLDESAMVDPVDGAKNPGGKKKKKKGKKKKAGKVRGFPKCCLFIFFLFLSRGLFAHEQVFCIQAVKHQKYPKVR